ncbi:MAG: hypothetical protein LBH56_02470, partial [Coriobacteriales bacterium]|nr:hypothetical protein [Coriobacteriales bacterium]
MTKQNDGDMNFSGGLRICSQWKRRKTLGSQEPEASAGHSPTHGDKHLALSRNVGHRTPRYAENEREQSYRFTRIPVKRR